MAAPSNPNRSKLDQEQIIQRVMDESTDRLRTDATLEGTIDLNIDAATGDNIAIADASGNKVTTTTIGADVALDVNIVGIIPVATDVNVLTSALPTGAATSALQTTGNASLSSIDSKLTSPLTVTGPLTDVQLRATAVPVSLSSSPLPTGAATEAKQDDQIALETTIDSSLSSIDSKLTDGTQETQIVNASGQSVGAKSLGTQVVSGDIGIITNSVIHGVTTGGGGGYVDVKVTPSGALVTDTTISGSLPLPTGASTSALQTTGNTSLNNIDTKLTNLTDSARSTIEQNGVGTGAAITNILVGGVYKSSPPTLINGDQSELILDDNGNLKVSGEMVISGDVSLDAATIAALEPLSVVSALLPQVTVVNGPSVAGPNNDILLVGGYDATQDEFRVFNFDNQSLMVSDSVTSSLISTLNNKIPNLGNADPSASSPVTLSNAVTVTFSQAAPAINYNFLTGVVSSTSWYDARAFNFGSISIQSTIANGTFIIEGTNDNTSAVGMIIPFNASNSTGIVSVVSNTTFPTASTNYHFEIKHRYIRIRTVTASTGTVTCKTLLKQSYQQNNNVFVNAGSLSSVNSVSTVSTVSSITSSNTGIGVVVVDVASAAITTTTTTATLTPGFGTSYVVHIPVTLVSGTNPTMDVDVQESDDNGTNWYTVYSFPRITATGSYRSPTLVNTGTRIRYIQTVGGTTPSFTRSVQRVQKSTTPQIALTQLINRSLDPNTLNSVTSSLITRDARNCELNITCGAITTTPPTLTLERTNDFGVTWFGSATLVGVANSTVALTLNNMNSWGIRARVSSAGVGVTLGSVLLKGF